MRLRWKLVSFILEIVLILTQDRWVRLEIVVVLTQDRCTVSPNMP
jgi:hypothetical protein